MTDRREADARVSEPEPSSPDGRPDRPPAGAAGPRPAAYRGPWFTPDDATAIAERLGDVALCGDGVFSADGLTADELVALLEEAETIRSASAAVMARAAAALEARTREDRAARNLPRSTHREGVAQQVAAARRLSPHRAALRLGTAHLLVDHMPHTFAALAAGRLSEERATLIARGLPELDVHALERLDEVLSSDPAAWDGMGDRAVRDRVARAACRFAPTAMAAEADRARRRRHVAVRPGRHGMATLSAQLPAADAHRVHSTLSRVAEAAHGTEAALDPAGRARRVPELMADTLVDRVTSLGEDPDLDLPPSQTPVEVGIILTDRTLLAADDEPAVIDGYGTVPAEAARQAILTTDDQNLFLRRLYTHPATGQLVAMDSRARIFPAGLKRLIRYRDRHCRTPYCDAPIRHTDHIVPWASGGPTSFENGQGLCARCNQAKEAPGHTAVPGSVPTDSGTPPGTTGGSDRGHACGRHAVSWTMPTGRTYHSTAPPMPGKLDLPSRQDAPRSQGRPDAPPAGAPPAGAPPPESPRSCRPGVPGEIDNPGPGRPRNDPPLCA